MKDTWPAAGPRVIWKRPLGEGYSSPAVENGVLYTMYGKPREEVVLAANAETGADALGTRHADDVSRATPAREMGNGPYSTPLIVGDRCSRPASPAGCSASTRRPASFCGRSSSGRTISGSRLMYGYASSPIAFRETVIVPVGGPGKALMAFQQADGKVAWSKNDFGNVYSSPVLINVERTGTAGGADGRRDHRRQSAQRRSAVAGAVQGRLFDRGRDAGLGPRQPAVHLLRIRRRREGDRAEAQRPADDGDGTVELEPAAAPSRQRDSHRRRDLLLERRQGQPGDSERGRRRAAARFTGRSAASRKPRSCGRIRS